MSDVVEEIDALLNLTLHVPFQEIVEIVLNFFVVGYDSIAEHRIHRLLHVRVLVGLRQTARYPSSPVRERLGVIEGIILLTRAANCRRTNLAQTIHSITHWLR